MWAFLTEKLGHGDFKALARAITLIENEQEGYESFLRTLPQKEMPVIGITGPPGAGKSTLTDALIEQIVTTGKKVAVLCIDPSSPFHLGALLGDRIRLSNWYTHPNVYIRSLASRGSMGGLNSKILEITDILRAAPFDIIIVETVGVGQSEIEIAGLADVTVVVLVPEGGDEIQAMKAGLMEIADIFVVNKSDRPGAERFLKNLRQMLAPAFSKTDEEIPILQTIAREGKGIDILYEAIIKKTAVTVSNERKSWLLTEKVYQLIQKRRMKDVMKLKLYKEIEAAHGQPGFNLYQFIQKIESNKVK